MIWHRQLTFARQQLGVLMVILLTGAGLGTWDLRAATANQALHRFYENVSSVSASFRQVVFDEQSKPIEEASGTMMIKRPGRFRWDYDKPTPQHIVSDGRRVWLYDVELEQVTVRLLEKTLGQTPAALLAGGRDIQNSFDLYDLPATGKIEWVQLTPKQPDTGFDDIRIGFEDGKVKVMELVDGLGQTTRITLTQINENPPIADDEFFFQPPPGVDVIDESLRRVR